MGYVLCYMFFYVNIYVFFMLTYMFFYVIFSSFFHTKLDKFNDLDTQNTFLKTDFSFFEKKLDSNAQNDF